MEILVINAGSSSVRVAGYRATGRALQSTGRHRVEGQAVRSLPALIEAARLARPTVVVHRVVHGGRHLMAPCEIDATVEAEIARLSTLAPLHNPVAAEWIAASRAALPDAMQIAVFDTAFFATLPEVAATYALSRELSHRLGIRRYGFHGIAHQAIWRAWQRATQRTGPGKLISFQLGAGCSAAAIADGRPIDTSMGMTPLEGLVMATRSGDVDPGAMLHLLHEGGLTRRELDVLFYEHSGLRGISGVSGDVHELLVDGGAGAALAIDLYCHRARKYLGAYLAELGGADAIAFAGGVGEHEPEIRARIAAGATFCGLRIDETANLNPSSAGPLRISTPDSAIEAWVIPLDEEAVLAEEALPVARGRA